MRFRGFFRSLLCGLLLALCFAGLTPAGVVQADESRESDVFRVGMEAGYPPFNWTQQTDANGAVKISGNNEYAGGYDVEIAKIIAEKLGKKLEIVKVEWDGLAPALDSNKIDAIIAGMSPTEERKKSIDFTDVYYQSNLVIVVKHGSQYENATSLEDFKGAKITGQLNTFHYSVIDQIPGVEKQTAMDNFSAMRVALESGIIDGYVTERPEGLSAQKTNPIYKMVDFKAGQGFVTNSDDTAISIGLRKGDPLRVEINKILAGISLDEQQEIMDEAVDTQLSSEAEGSWIVKIVKENWPMFLRGAGTTLLIAITGTIIGTLIGLLIGVVRTIPKAKNKTKNAVLKVVSWIFNIYIEIFRGTPMIVQSMVIYYGVAKVFDIHLNLLFAAIFIVSINTGAYMSEIVRGGIYAVDKGQFEAAHAMGMTHFQTMMNIILPQVIRNILPATGNEFVINIKDTSVLNVISVTELYFAGKTVAGANLRYFETYFVIAAIYLVLTFTITRILRLLEKRMDGPDSYSFANQDQVTDPKRLAEERR